MLITIRCCIISLIVCLVTCGVSDQSYSFGESFEVWAIFSVVSSVLCNVVVAIDTRIKVARIKRELGIK